MGYIPIGMTFGLLGYQQGLGPFQVLSFSLFVFAGSAQFVGLGLLADHITSPLEVFVTIWLVNLRHAILSLAYMPSSKHWTFLQKARFYPILTDENFALLTSAPDIKTDPVRAFRLSLINYVAWSAGTALGYAFGGLFPDPNLLGLDFALPALFFGIIVLFVKRTEHIVTLLAAIVLTFISYYCLNLGRASVIVSAVIASFIGSSLEWKRTNS